MVGVLTGTRKDKPRRNCLASQISIVIAFLHPVLCFGYVSFWIRFVLDMFWFWLVLVLGLVSDFRPPSPVTRSEVDESQPAD